MQIYIIRHFGIKYGNVIDYLKCLKITEVFHNLTSKIIKL